MNFGAADLPPKPVNTSIAPTTVYVASSQPSHAGMVFTSGSSAEPVGERWLG